MTEEKPITIDREIAEAIAFERTGRYSTDVDDKGDHFLVHFGLSESMVIPKLAIEAGLFKLRSLDVAKLEHRKRIDVRADEAYRESIQNEIREYSIEDLFRIHSCRELGLIEIEFLKRLRDGFPVTCDRKDLCHGENNCVICGDVSETCEKPNCKVHPFKSVIYLSGGVSPGATSTISTSAMGGMLPIRFEVDQKEAEHFMVDCLVLGNGLQFTNGGPVTKIPATDFARGKDLKIKFDPVYPGIGVRVTVTNQDSVKGRLFSARLVGLDLEQMRELNARSSYPPGIQNATYGKTALVQLVQEYIERIKAGR